MRAFYGINPGFGRPWGMLWILFVNGTFIMPQKKSFGQKIFEFHTRVQKCNLAEWKNCQNDTFEPEHEIQKFFWPKDFF